MEKSTTVMTVKSIFFSDICPKTIHVLMFTKKLLYFAKNFFHTFSNLVGVV